MGSILAKHPVIPIYPMHDQQGRLTCRAFIETQDTKPGVQIFKLSKSLSASLSCWVHVVNALICNPLKNPLMEFSVISSQVKFHRKGVSLGKWSDCGWYWISKEPVEQEVGCKGQLEVPNKCLFSLLCQWLKQLLSGHLMFYHFIWLVWDLYAFLPVLPPKGDSHPFLFFSCWGHHTGGENA